jgi:hypothetical protein
MMNAEVAVFFMRLWLRRCVTLLATYAVALHVIVLGFAPIDANAFAAIDPFTVICHTTAPAAAPGELPKGKLALIPSRAIDHCNLCSAAAPPPAPDTAFAVDFSATRVLHVFRPMSAQVRSAVTANPRLSRGPPQLT